MISLSVVIPAYNEERVVEEVIRAVIRELEKYCREYEVIVLDDSSTDRTKKIISKLKDEYPTVMRIYFNKKRKGIAYTLERLFSVARMDYILDIPGDGQIKPSVIREVVPMMKQNDIVVCMRRKKFYSLYRGIVSLCYRQFPKWLFGIDLYDPGCAKCVKREIRQRGNEISRGVFIEAERCIRAIDDSYLIGKVDINLLEGNKGNGTGGHWLLVVEAVYDMTRFWWYWRVRKKGRNFL